MIFKFIFIFFLVLSIIYCGKHLLKVIIKLFQENPSPLVLDMIPKILLYAASTYIITSIIFLLT